MFCSERQKDSEFDAKATAQPLKYSQLVEQMPYCTKHAQTF